MAASEQIAEVINFKHTDPNPQPNNGDLWREGSQLKYHNGTTTVDLANPSTMTLVEGDGITIDATDPDAPVISLTDFANLDGLTSNVQTQLDAKANAASVPSVVVKAANQSRNTTTTYADDSELKFTVEANKSYRVKIWVEYTLGAGGAKFQLAGPASTTVNRVMAHVNQGLLLHLNAGSGTLPVAFLNDANTSGTNVLLVECIVRTTNAGTVSLQWAQSTSNGANSTVLAQSYIEWQKMN